MVIYGRNSVLEGLKSNFRPIFFAIQKGIRIDDKLQQIINECKARKIEIKEMSSQEIDKLTSTEDNQGVGLKIDFQTQKLKTSLEKRLDYSYLYITESFFTHNIGAIARTAEVAGLGGVIIPPNIDITPAMVKTSAGALMHIPVIKESLFNCIKLFRAKGFLIFGIERQGTKYFEANLAEPSLFIIGGENKSLTNAVRDKCDQILEIPQFGKVNSLNMSVASSLIIYEQVRQRLSQTN